MSAQLLVQEFDRSKDHLVPYSELAMHMRIAGRLITYAHVTGRTATICVDGHKVHYSGLVSELLPFELRGLCTCGYPKDHAYTLDCVPF